jgi:adenylosuccinate synthase
MEIYCGNKSKCNQLSEEQTINHKVLTKLPFITHTIQHLQEWNNSKMEQSLHKMQYFYQHIKKYVLYLSQMIKS